MLLLLRALRFRLRLCLGGLLHPLRLRLRPLHLRLRLCPLHLWMHSLRLRLCPLHLRLRLDPRLLSHRRRNYLRWLRPKLRLLSSLLLSCRRLGPELLLLL